MHINPAREPIAALIAGIVVMVAPRTLDYARITLYLIVIGSAGVFGLPIGT